MSEQRVPYGDACIVEVEINPEDVLSALRTLALFHAAAGTRSWSILDEELMSMWDEARAAVDVLPREVVFPNEVER